MLGTVFTLSILLLAASAMAQSPKLDPPPPFLSASNVSRTAVPAADGLVAIPAVPLAADEQRQEDARRRAFLMLLLSSGGRVQPYAGMGR